MRHADFEALSAYADGEAPEWADHVAGCAACQTTVEEILALGATVAEPVTRPTAADRDAAIAAALAGSSPSGAHVDAAPVRRPTRRQRESKPWAMLAIAAVIIGVLGFSGILLSSFRTSDHETATLAEKSLDNAATPAGGGGGLAAAGPSFVPTDLGDVADAATLKARVQTGIPVASPQLSRAGDQSSATNSGSTSGGAASSATASGGSSAVVPPTTTLNQRAAGPNVVGTRPCEEQARSRDPRLREVTYFAVARKGPVEGYVLGFATGPAPAPVTLLLLARTDCAELVRASVP